MPESAQQESLASVSAEQLPSLGSSGQAKANAPWRQSQSKATARASGSVTLGSDSSGTLRSQRPGPASSSGTSSPVRERSSSPPGHAETSEGAGKIPVFCLYHERGRCNHGNACRFAHGQEELDAITTTLIASRNSVYKTKLCRFNEYGRCRSGDQCFFAHGEDELQGHTPASRADVERRLEAPKPRSSSSSTESTNVKVLPEGDKQALDPADDWSIMPSWFSDTCSETLADTDTCSTASEVMKADANHQADDFSEDDDASTALSSAQDNLVEDRNAEEMFDLACVKAHRWDGELGKWVLETIDLTAEPEEPLSKFWHEHISQEGNIFEEQSAVDSKEDSTAISIIGELLGKVQRIKLEESIPRTSLKKALADAAKRATLHEDSNADRMPRTSLREVLHAKKTAFTPSRTPLRTAAALFVPQEGNEWDETYESGAGNSWWDEPYACSAGNSWWED